MANSEPVVIASNQTAIPIAATAKLPVEIAETQADIHGQLVQVTRVTQLVTKFFQQTPQNALNITVSGGGTATSGIGTGVFSTSTAVTAAVLAQTPATILYSAQYEAWGVLSGAFTAPTSAASFQRLGLYNAVDGFAFGFNGLNFGVLTRFNSVDTFIPQTSWNRDVLSGAAASTFRNNNAPVALVPANMNMYRIRYGWYGAVDTYFEVYAPDGNWVVVHQVRTANSQAGVNLTNPNLPMAVEVSKTASDATNLSITCGGWAAGITVPSTGMLMSGQQSIAALNASLILPTTGLASLSFAISGTWVGTLSFQSSLDGITWNTFSVLDNTSLALATQTTVNGNFTKTVSTQRFYRVVATAWTSGTATLVYYGSAIDSVRPILLDATGRQSVIGTFFQATQPVSLAANTPVIAAGTASIGNLNELRASTLAVTGTAAAGTALTITLPAVAAAFHYITAIDLVLYSAAARTGAAAPTVVTTTNIPGAVAFTFSTAGAIGTTDVQDLIRTTPLKSSAVNTATTIVAPIAAGGIWRITVTYFTGA